VPQQVFAGLHPKLPGRDPAMDIFAGRSDWLTNSSAYSWPRTT